MTAILAWSAFFAVFAGLLASLLVAGLRMARDVGRDPEVQR
jgi:hypothetical protein